MEGSALSRKRPVILVCSIAILAIAFAPPQAGADEAQWIWANGSSLEKPIPEGETCLFRKPINLRVQAAGKIEIAADDRYELFVNGTRISTGRSSRQMQEIDISDHLVIGRNVIGVRVVNTHGETAALAAHRRSTPPRPGTGS